MIQHNDRPKEKNQVIMSPDKNQVFDFFSSYVPVCSSKGGRIDLRLTLKFLRKINVHK